MCARSFDHAESPLLERRTLTFVYEEVREQGWVFEHVKHATLEQRIFDEAGAEIGRVIETPRRDGPTLLENSPPASPVHASLHDARGSRILALTASPGKRRVLGRDRDWGRQLEVEDGAGQLLGTLEATELLRRGTLYDACGERIAKTRSRSVGWLNIALEDPAGFEIAWLADPSTHARRVGKGGKTFGSWKPQRHVLALSDDVTLEVRLMLLATSIGVHLALSPYSEPRE